MTKHLQLCPEHIQALLRDTLYNRDELELWGCPVPPNAHIVTGVEKRYGFHPLRLEHHRSSIERLVQQLPARFFRRGGRYDTQGWTNSPQLQDDLCCLAIGVGLCSLTGKVAHFALKL